VPRYLFSCGGCGLEFEVSRAMSEAGRAAWCPVDGAEAARVFTAPMTIVRPGERAAPAAAPSGEVRTRSWSLPFFPKSAPDAEAARPASKPRHVLPPGSSKPTRFRHFGHWHPAGTPPHTHPARRPRAPKPAQPAET
jgi:putative FmdB family regulatory protein